jgi:hypothetical protein
MTQDEILDALEDGREKFLDAIEGLPDEAMRESGVCGDWSMKDLLSHLSRWEAELVKLLWEASQGDQPDTVHFGKTSIDEMNAIWHKDSAGRPLERVMEDFIAVRKQTNRRVQAFSDEDLNDPQHFAWQRSEPLWKWVASDSFGHEEEHLAQVQEWRSRRAL